MWMEVIEVIVGGDGWVRIVAEPTRIAAALDSEEILAKQCVVFG
jgi:hypothetical protein